MVWYYKEYHHCTHMLPRLSLNLAPIYPDLAPIKKSRDWTLTNYGM